jgi:HNH endonuclease
MTEDELLKIRVLCNAMSILDYSVFDGIPREKRALAHLHRAISTVEALPAGGIQFEGMKQVLHDWLRNEEAEDRRRTRLAMRRVRSTQWLEDDGLKCVYCEAVEGIYHVDHVVPRALGGSDETDNKVIACAWCNLTKSAHPPAVWLRSERLAWRRNKIRERASRVDESSKSA